MKTADVASQRLRSFIERIEKLIEERKAIQGDIKDVFSEAKGVGYDVPAMRKVIALRAMDQADRAEMETLIDTYMHALGDGKRAAVEAMQQGAGTREAARVAGIAVGAASQLRTGVHGIANGEHPTPPHDSETGEISAAETAGESCGGAGSPSAEASFASPEVAPGPQDTRTFEEITGPIPPFLDRRPDSAKRPNVTETA